MALAPAAVAHVNAQSGGVREHQAQPSQTNPSSGVASIPIVSDVGELGGLLFGHTLGDNVVTNETVSTAHQTSLGGFIPAAQHALNKATPTNASASPRTIAAATLKGEVDRVRSAFSKLVNRGG